MPNGTTCTAPAGWSRASRSLLPQVRLRRGQQQPRTSSRGAQAAPAAPQAPRLPMGQKMQRAVAALPAAASGAAAPSQGQTRQARRLGCPTAASIFAMSYLCGTTVPDQGKVGNFKQAERANLHEQRFGTGSRVRERKEEIYDRALPAAGGIIDSTWHGGIKWVEGLRHMVAWEWRGTAGGTIGGQGGRAQQQRRGEAGKLRSGHGPGARGIRAACTRPPGWRRRCCQRRRRG